MTTIAYKDGQMAADRQLTYQGAIKLNNVKPKIARDANGVLYGVCGSHSMCCALVEAVQKQAQTEGVVTIPVPQKGDEFEILIAYPDGRLRRLVPGGEEIYDDMPYFAIGAGLEVAMGAMYAGASAQLAIEAAVVHSVGTGGEIDVLWHPERLKRAGMPAELRRGREDYEQVPLGHLAGAVEQAYREMTEVPTVSDTTPDGHKRVNMVAKLAGRDPAGQVLIYNVRDADDEEKAFERIARGEDGSN